MKKEQLLSCKIFMVFFLLLVISIRGSAEEMAILNTPIVENAKEDSDKKIYLHWKQIAPYIVMQEKCEGERMIFLYSELDNLLLVAGSTKILPQEAVPTHKVKNTKSRDTQIVSRYVFCVDKSLKTFVIKNDLYESYPIDLEYEDFSLSKNMALVLDLDNDYLTSKSEKIEEAETWRSNLLEDMYLSAQKTVLKLDLRNQNIESESLLLDEEIEVVKVNVSTGDQAQESVEGNQNIRTEFLPIDEEIEVLQVDVGTESQEPERIEIQQVQNMNVEYIEERFIQTDDSFNIENIVLNDNGNGYKIQIIAKKRNDYDAQSIQYYYGIPYHVEEHFDGIWHRFTLKGYESSWSEVRALLRTIRDGYGITDAFISLYQNYERVGIYPCSENNILKNPAELAEYISELEGGCNF